MIPVRALIIMGMILVAGTGTAIPDTLTLDECVRLALDRNYTIMAGRESVTQAEFGVAVSRSSILPRLEASSNYSKSGNGTTTDSYSSNLTLSQKLFQGGGNLASIKAAKVQVEIAKQSQRLTESQVVQSVKETFYEVVQKENRLRLTEEIEKRRNEDLILIRLKHRAGTESDAAVSEAEASLLAAEYDRLSAEEGLALAKISLNLLLGRPKGIPLQTETGTELPQFPERDEAVKSGLLSRPEIAREEARIELENAYLSRSRSEFFPELSFNSSIGRRGKESFSGDDFWSAGVSLNLPIFQGFRRQASYSQSKSSVRQQQALYLETRQTVEEDIERAYSGWLLAAKRMEVAEKSASAARQMYALTRLQYQQGRVSYFIFQQRELSLTLAENEKVNASYGLFTAAAALTRALGWDSDTSEGDR